VSRCARIRAAREKTVQWLSGSHSLFGGTLVVSSNIAAPSVSAVVFGPTVAAGARIGRRRLGPTVEFRYTRWFDAALAEASFSSVPSWIVRRPCAPVRIRHSYWWVSYFNGPASSLASR
jgi:hypothetical protein